MYRNLYKSGWVVLNSDDARVIDNNALVEEKMNASSRAAVQSEMPIEPAADEDGFKSGLEAESIDALFASEDSGFLKNEELEKEKEELLLEIEAAKAELSELRMQADGMLEEAKAEIGNMQMKAYEEAKNQGYQEGERLGRLESDAAKKEYEDKKKELVTYYEKKVKELEPEFIETLTGIYEHIFKVDLSSYKELIFHLFENAIQKTDGSSSLLLHVSKADYEGVAEKKEYLKSQVGNASVEVIEDITLSELQCYIETDNGIYDCGLDTQLEELARKLKLLSYER
ncbi:MAG: hypothetical protein J6J79_07375 [Lachnospiraceae bacterium]|nr:hypothetical protein [Lachnospiraceae bacterium]